MASRANGLQIRIDPQSTIIQYSQTHWIGNLTDELANVPKIPKRHESKITIGRAHNSSRI